MGVFRECNKGTFNVRYLQFFFCRDSSEESLNFYNYNFFSLFHFLVFVCDMAEQEEDYTNLSIQDKLQHKVKSSIQQICFVHL